MTYQAKYGHSADDTPGILDLIATTDAEAVAEVRAFVKDGVRSCTWASVELADGRSYVAGNLHGAVLSRYSPAL